MTNDLLPDRKYDGQCFEVFLFATQERPDDAGYYQYIEAKDPETFDLVSKLIELIPRTAHGDFQDMRIVVQQHTVWSRSGTGYEAIRRFKEWLEMGYPTEWLIEPSYKKEINNV